MATALDDVLSRLGVMDEADRSAVVKAAYDATKDMVWVPNSGPQTDAFESLADELFYGGSAGGGKSDLLIGLANTKHTNSLLLRRVNKDVEDLVDRMATIVGDRTGYNGQLHRWFRGRRAIYFSGCQTEKDKQRHKGKPHDLKGFDEISDFTESQYRFIITWNRSTVPGQRSRVVCTGNPPTEPEGLWVLKYWAAWLDPTHPNPAKPGELRWYTTINGVDTEVDGPGPHMVNGKPIRARSRTYIPAQLQDNPDLKNTDYDAVLDSLPEEFRAAYRDGNFQAGVKDAPYQIIPTAWIVAAQERWKPDGYKNFAMTAMAVDPAGGGKDAQELAHRHGGWFGELYTEKGKSTGDPSMTFGQIMAKRRDNAPVVVDVGGGYGGAIKLRLNDNGIPFAAFNGADGSNRKAKGSNIPFKNKRAEAIFFLAEALDPDQEGGSVIALPPDPELRADLASYRYSPRALQISGVYQVESKEEIRKRIGRSPGKGDAVFMCLSEGGRAVEREARKRRFGGNLPTHANVGYSNLKRRRS